MATGADIWQQAARIVRAARPEPAPTLIHRDFHPGNTLWSGSRLTGVVDWTQASWGPAALDLGHLRWNLVLDHSLERADQLLVQYQAVTTTLTEDQSYWDLVSVFDLLLDGEPSEPGDLDAQDQQRPTAGCGGFLGPWGWARERAGRGVGRLPPRRSRCLDCGCTRVLLPASVLLRRSTIRRATPRI